MPNPSPLSLKPPSLEAFQHAQRGMIKALLEVDRMGLHITGAMLQHALDTIQSEWVDAQF